VQTRVLLVNHGQAPGETRANIDPVLARCSGIFSKADYALPPVGLLSCATYVEAAVDGVRCELVDLSVEGQHGESALRRVEPLGGRVLVSTPASSSLERDLGFCRAWQEQGTSRWVVSLGTHTTEEPDSVLRGDRWVAVRGEPEVALAKVVAQIAGTEGAEPLSEAVPGVSFRRADDTVHHPGTSELLDLAKAPIPDHGRLARYHYSPPFARAGSFALVLTSRGCPFGCLFCASQSLYGRKQRNRPLPDVISEVRHLARDCGIRNVGFWDDNLTTSRVRTLELCEGLTALPERVRWICLSRVDTVDAELLEAMARAGCYQIQYGVESGVERVRSLLGKPQSVDRVRQTFAETRQAGIETVGFFMLGIPGETAAEREQTVEVALELDPDYVSFNVCTPLPGAPLYDRLPEGSKGELWSSMDARAAVGDPGDGERGAIEEAMRRAYRRFYFRPKTMWRQLARLGSPREILRLAKAAWFVARSNWA
jgi:anaerobic magnesium-protoporphyrin IX monomethyl ester cyclase